MKVTLSSAVLRDALSRAIRVVARTTTMPVLSTILVQANDGKITLTATDMEVTITTSVAATVVEAGDICLPGRKFHEVVGKLPAADLTLETDDEFGTSITCGKSRFKLVGMATTDFPRESEFQEDRRFSLPAQSFGRSLRKISYAISTDQSRYVLAGVLLHLSQGQLTTVATDGRRLALVERPLEDATHAADGEWILPHKVVSELSALLAGDGNVDIRLSDSRAGFLVGETTVTTKLVDGRYPNFRQVIPGSFTRQAVLSRTGLAEVIDRVGTVIVGTSQSLRVTFSNGQLELSANSPEWGEASEPVEASCEGDPVKIAFNGEFLRQPLGELETDQVTLKFNDEFKPVLMQGDEGFLYVIMPMRH